LAIFAGDGHKMQIVVKKKYIKYFLIPCIVAIAVFNFLTFYEYQSLFRVNNDIIESYQTIRAANQVIISINEAGLKVGGLLLGNDETGVKNLPEIIISAQLNMTTLNQLIQDNQMEIDFYKQLKPLFDQKVQFLQNVLAKYSAGDKAGAIQIGSDPNRLLLTEKIAQFIIEIKKIETNQLEDNRTKLDTDMMVANALFILVSLITLGLLMFCYYILNREDSIPNQSSKNI
jgi:CHASE3 domain sensor protein